MPYNLVLRTQVLHSITEKFNCACKSFQMHRRTHSCIQEYKSMGRNTVYVRIHAHVCVQRRNDKSGSLEHLYQDVRHGTKKRHRKTERWRQRMFQSDHTNPLLKYLLRKFYLFLRHHYWVNPLRSPPASLPSVSFYID